MASITQTGDTPARVAKMATASGRVTAGKLNLIGLFGPQNNLSALVREASGRIRRVKKGQSLSTGRIMAIDENGLMMEKNGRTWRLSLPSG